MSVSLSLQFFLGELGCRACTSPFSRVPTSGTLALGANPFGGTSHKQQRIETCCGMFGSRSLIAREPVAKIFICRGFALEMVCTLRNDDLRWKISFRSVRRASATLCTPARGSLLVLLSTDPQLTLSSPSQRPTHSGSIFRLLLKIAVGLPRSCDSSQFLQGFGPNIKQTWSDRCVPTLSGDASAW